MTSTNEYATYLLTAEHQASLRAEAAAERLAHEARRGAAPRPRRWTRLRAALRRPTPALTPTVAVETWGLVPTPHR